MGCVCCSLSSFISILLDALERISLCTVCALLMCCLLWTIIIILVLGVGIGYHYCFVQTSVEAMARAAKSASVATRSGPERTIPSQTASARRRDHRNSPGLAMAGRARRDVDLEPPFTNNGTRRNSTIDDDNGTFNDTIPISTSLNFTKDSFANFNITNSTSVI